ncbi:hypothetical protein C0995_013838 [Termitomyces sp. Mi166|nr:hypothetical protein C0995_013838 [Termitomyces sp. Mi166\
MLLYTDILAERNDEMFSDAFPIKLIDNIVYEVDCQLMTVKAGADVDIGANPSAEEADEALEDGATQVNNVGYMKALKEKLPEERREAFEKGAQAYAKKIVTNFKDYEFTFKEYLVDLYAHRQYTGENMDAEGMVALLNYREDGVTPYFTFWKDGLKEVKL